MGTIGETLSLKDNLIAGLKILGILIAANILFAGLLLIIGLSSLFTDVWGKVLFFLILVFSFPFSIYLQGLIARLPFLFGDKK